MPVDLLLDTRAPKTTLPRPPVNRVLLLRILAVIWVSLAAVVQLLRSSHTPTWDSVWAEDGRFFYGDALAHPWSSTLGKPLANYLQLAPRILSEVAAQFPVRDGALLIAGLAALATALLSIYVFVATGGIVPRTWQRFAIAGIVVLHPAAAYEVNSAVNNLHWYLMFAAFWACLSTGHSHRRLAVDLVVLVLAVLSDPLTGLLLPILAIRLWRKASAARWLTGAMVLALGTQYIWGINGTPRAGSRDPGKMPLVYGLRVAGSFLFGDQAIKTWWDHLGQPLAVLSLLCVGALFALAILIAAKPERRFLALLLLYSMVFFVAPFWVRGGAAALLRHPATLNGSRYMITPLWFLYSALFVAAGLRLKEGSRFTAKLRTAARGRHPERLPARFGVALLPSLAVLIVGLQLVFNFASSAPRTSSTSWKAGVTYARALCSGQPTPGGPLRGSARPVLLSKGIVAIPTAPWGRHYFWSVRLRCDRLKAVTVEPGDFYAGEARKLLLSAELPDTKATALTHAADRPA